MENLRNLKHTWGISLFIKGVTLHYVYIAKNCFNCLSNRVIDSCSTFFD